MSVAAAGGSDGGDNKWKGKSHADDDQSQLSPLSSSSTDDEDLDVKVLEDVRRHANKKRRLRVAAEEDRKLLNEDADQAADELIVDADIDTDEVIVDAEDAVVKDDDKAEGSAAAKNGN